MGLLRYVPDRPKRLAKRVLGKELHYAPRTLRPRQMHGSNDGLWCLCPDHLDEHSIVYSFGVGLDISFDLSLIETYGLTVHAFDPTPRSIEWVRSQTLPEQFVFHPYGLADHDGEVSFNPPLSDEFVSHTMLDRPATRGRAITVPVKRLNTIMDSLQHERTDVLKLDIEGAEYEVIDSLLRSHVRPRQILVEFHHRFPGVGLRRTRSAIRTLEAMGYQMFHVSAEQSEFGFIRDVKQGEVRWAA